MEEDSWYSSSADDPILGKDGEVIGKINTWTSREAGVGCKLTTMYPSTTDNDKCRNLLKIYDVRNKPMSSLPLFIPQLAHIDELDISRNNLREIPKVLYSLSQLQTLDMVDNQLTSVHSDISNMASLKDLDLSTNKISDFPTAVCNLSQLQTLKMNYNQLTSVHPEITNMTSLIDLNLSANKFSDFPTEVCRLPQLYQLNMSRNQLTSVDRDISNVASLINLDLSTNRFSVFPTAVCSLPQLQTLNMSNNQLTSVLPDISNMTSLTFLDLCGNKFTDFPTAVCSLPQLRKLNISNNQLTSVHPDISTMTSLIDLDVSHNKLTSLHPHISKLTSLKHLDLCGNTFTDFPADVCKLPQLQKLQMWNTNLTSVPPDISKITSLTHLDLCGNAFTAFPTAICRLPQLQTLKMNYNQLTSVDPEISNMTSLIDLYLIENNFTDFPTAICSVPQLEDLNLNGNPLTNISGDIAKLSKLKALSLQNTKLTHLPNELEHLDMLKKLDVSSCPLIQPPESVCKSGVDAIFRYLKSLRESKAVNTSRLQLNILGDTGSGKTSLSQSLLKGEPILTPEADRTHVIEQETWDPEEEVSFNINDFGGNDVYRVGYPIFIHKKGEALITFDLSTYEPDNELQYKSHIGDWVRTVQDRTPDAPLTICGTHQDKVDEAPIQRVCEDAKKRLHDDTQNRGRRLKAQIENISRRKKRNPALLQKIQSKQKHLEHLQSKTMANIPDEIFTISSADMTGFEELTEHLISRAKKRRVVLPGAWVDVMHKIEKKKYDKRCNTLTLEDVRSFVRDVALKNRKAKSSDPEKTRLEEDEEMAVSEEEINHAVQDILDYMSSSGEVVWLDTNSTLRQVIFHKQEVLANLLKALLHHDMEEKRYVLISALKFPSEEIEKITENFLRRGIISREAMHALWTPFNLNNEEEDAMVELMQALELCYIVTKPKTLPDREKDIFHFPWLLAETRPDAVDQKWPHIVPHDVIQFTLQFVTCCRFPDGLFERLSVRLHKHLGSFCTRRLDWKDGVYAELDGCKLCLTHQQEGRDWLITAAVRGKHAPENWDFLLNVHEDLKRLLDEEWLGLSYFRYLVCPHCVQEGLQKATKFSEETDEILDNPSKKPRHKTFPCDNAPDGTIPASLIYPVLAGKAMEDLNQLRQTQLPHTLVQQKCETQTEEGASVLYQNPVPNVSPLSRLYPGKRKAEEGISTTQQRPIAKVACTSKLATGTDVNEDPDVEVSLCTADVFEKKAFSDEVYRNFTEYRGRAVIINNCDFKDNPPRLGTEVDVTRLTKLFEQLHYVVIPHDNLPACTIQQIAENEARLNHGRYCSFIMVILSHGTETSVIGSDGYHIAFNQILEPFEASRCPTLKGRPKMFFISACQNPPKSTKDRTSPKSSPRHVESREQTTPEKADMILVSSTTPGDTSWRSEDEGTWFVQNLVEVFSKKAKNKHLEDMLTEVRRAMSERKTKDGHCQISNIERNTLTKKVYFFPGFFVLDEKKKQFSSYNS